MAERPFIIDYWSRGRRLTATIHANDWHEAEQRLASLKMTGEIAGERIIEISVPASSRWVRFLCAWNAAVAALLVFGLHWLLGRQ